MPLLTLAIQNAVDVRFVGQATSASQFFRQTGATVGAAIMGTLLATTLGLAFAEIEMPATWAGDSDTPLEELVSTGGADLPDRISLLYLGLAEDAANPAAATALVAEGAAVTDRIMSEVREAFSLATSRIYWLTALIMLVAALLTLRIPELPLRTTHDRVG